MTKLKTKKEKTSRQPKLAVAGDILVGKFFNATSAHAISLLAFMLSANSVHASCGQVACFHNPFVRGR